MKRIAAFIFVMLSLCLVPLVPGFRTAPTDHDITWATNTSRPALPVSPMPVYAPQIAAMEESVPMELNQVLVIGVMVVLLAIIMYLLKQDNDKTKQIVEMAKQLRESLPEWGADLLVSGFNVIDARLETEFDKTATTIDNELWSEIEARIRSTFNLPAPNTEDAPPPANKTAVG